jgi:hypothetical protein
MADQAQSSMEIVTAVMPVAIETAFHAGWIHAEGSRR